MTPAEYLPWMTVAANLIILALAAGKAREKLDAAEKRIIAQEKSFEERLSHMDESWRANVAKLDSAWEQRMNEVTSRMTSGEGRREAVNSSLAQTREELANFRGAQEAQMSSLKDGVDGVKREVSEINRRLGKIAEEMFSANGRRRTRTTE